MQETASASGLTPPAGRKKQKHISWTLGAGLGLACLAFLAPERLFTLPLATAAATLICLGLVLAVVQRHSQQRRSADLSLLRDVIRRDATPSLIADRDGRISGCNPAAAQRYDVKLMPTVAGVLKRSIANPAAIVRRLQGKAAQDGGALEDVFTRSGHLRVSVHEVNADVFIWRVELIAERDAPRQGVDAHQLPMVMVGRSDAILYMNDAARQLVGARIKALDRLFTSLPVPLGVRTTLSTKTGSCDVLVAEVPAAAGRRALYFLPAPDVARSASPEQGWEAFQDLPVPLIKLAPDGAVQSFNKIAAKLVGVALHEGAQLHEVMEGLGRAISDWIKDTLEDRGVQKSEFLRLKRADREVFVQVVLTRIETEEAPALLAVLHDATELKTLEAKFVQSQKMQAIGQLAGGVAHDFNNLLTAISGHCDLLLLRHDQNDPDYGDLMQINQNANRAAALVGQLLAFSRKQTQRLQTIDLRDTLADLTHLLNRLVGERITLTLSHDPLLKPVRADKRQLEQVLMNLVVNARDALPAGGEIRITTQAVDVTEAFERDRVTVPVGAYATVVVSDDGIGIPPDKLQKVFEPFYTTKKTGEGTGLGLSTAYGIIKQTSGFIFVDSQEGEGTTFTLYLPVYEIKQPKQIEPARSNAMVTNVREDGVILLVEDEAPVRAFASRALRLQGYTVLEADSAEAALRTLEDGALNIDVFVTDVVMPGMDGPSWVREALKARPDVRVVFVSGYAEESFGEEQTKIPNSVFLPKPFSLADLTQTVQSQLH